MQRGTRLYHKAMRNRFPTEYQIPKIDYFIETFPAPFHSVPLPNGTRTNSSNTPR